MNRKVNILFVIDNLNFGGGERVFAQLMNVLPKRGYNISLAAHPGKALYSGIDHHSVNVFPVNFHRRFSPFLVMSLLRIIKNRQIDIVHSQGLRSDFHTRLASRLAGRCRVVCTVAAPVEKWNVGYMRKWLYASLDRLSEMFVHHFITVSGELENLLIHKHHIDKHMVTRIPNGIELDQFTPVNPDAAFLSGLGIPSQAPLVGSIGRIIKAKGMPYLVKAFESVLRKVKEAKLIIAGTGPAGEDLRRLIRSLRLESSVYLPGFVNDIRQLMAALDVLVIPSLSEGFPMVTLEGMAMEKPIVATNISGITEQLTDGETGILVHPEDPDAIADGIIRIITDRKLARRLGQNGRKSVVDRFSVNKMISETEKVYQSLI